MAERKKATAKKNRNRPHAKDRGLVSSMQRNYSKPKKIDLTISMFKTYND